MTDAVGAFLAQEGNSLVLLGSDAPSSLTGTALPASSLAGKFDRVLVCFGSRVSLRGASVPFAVRAPSVAVYVASAPTALGFSPRPEWPPMKALRVQPVGDGFLVVARFGQPVRVANVVRELGRQSVWPGRNGAGLVVSRSAVVGDALLALDVPPDLVLGSAEALPVHPVLTRSPVSTLSLAGPLSIGPLDERVINPIGFNVAAASPAVSLSSLDVSLATDRLIAELRDVQGVTGPIDASDASLVASLAMAGVPVHGSVSPSALVLLGKPVADALTEPVDLTDSLAREEHSIVLRRAAFDTFSRSAWQRLVAEQIGVRVATRPLVSVVLATMRADMLPFTLTQVAKQRGADVQLVLAPHGHRPDPALLREWAGPTLAERMIVRHHDQDTLFGDVLADAVDAADGDLVLKMDDDDWYGPDVIADLLRARDYSGAQMIGMHAEFHYLAPKNLTVRRGHPSEYYAHFIAGGTMMIERTLLRSIGNFRRVRKYVDAQLIASVEAEGAEIYRTHGLGYLLRRNATGHTWEVDMDYLLDPSRVAGVREGFHPSRLLEVNPSELP